MPDPAHQRADPRVPVFFLSYARARTADVGEAHDADEPVVTLFNDLVKHLNQLVGARAGANVGFIDREMRAGAFWNEQLRYALGSCGVFVPLICAPYFHSEWCGREWGGFTQRRILPLPATGTPQFTSAIVPVVWAPNTEPWRPRVSARVQNFSPAQGDLAALYESHGVYGLLALGRTEDYKAVTWDLAKHISQIYHSCVVVERKFEEGDEIEDVFNETGLT